MSVIYDITHGAGLSILVPYRMEYVLEANTVEKIASYASNVWGISCSDPYEAAREGISRTRRFFNQLVLLEYLSQVGIRRDRLDEVVEKTMRREKLGSIKEWRAHDLAGVLCHYKTVNSIFQTFSLT